MLGAYKKEIEGVKSSLKEAIENLLKANKTFLDATLDNCKEEEFKEAKLFLKNFSQKIENVDNEIVKILALFSPEAKDLREVVAYFKITNELLRASSNTRSLIKGFTQNCKLLDQSIINEYLVPLQSSAIKALEITLQMLDIDDVDDLRDMFHTIIVEEDKTDELYTILEKKIINSINKDDDFTKIHNILRAFRRSEKIADRTISIANLLLYIQDGGILSH